MRRTLSTLVAAALAVVTLTACGAGSPTTTPTASTGADFPVTVGSVTLAQRPARIVSLAPTATEMLFAINAGSQVVAVDEFSTYPTNAPKTSLSGYKPNAEAIAAYKPDLVVASDDAEKIVSQLAALKIPVFLTPAATTLDDTYQQINALGQLTGHKTEATTEVSKIQDDLFKLVHDAPKHGPLTYYYELDPSYYSVTSKSFIGSLFALVGLTNIADAASASNPYPQLSAEVIVKANPDLIFLADTKCCGQSGDTVGRRAGWSGIKAVKNGLVVQLDDDIASRWGPRVVDLLRAITDAVAKAPAS